MTGAKLVFDVDTDAIGRAIHSMLRAVDNPAPVLDYIGAAMETTTLRRFERAADPDGVPWLKSARVLNVGLKGKTGVTLTKSSDLKKSITHSVTGKTAEIGTNVIYAAIHQFGGEIKRGRRTVGQMPKRAFLGLSRDDGEIVLAILKGAIKEAAGG